VLPKQNKTKKLPEKEIKETIPFTILKNAWE
jgi:hypothetical protein